MLARYNDLNYFQGYHDIASIVLLVPHGDTRLVQSVACHAGCLDSHHRCAAQITEDVRISYGILEALSLNHFRYPLLQSTMRFTLWLSLIQNSQAGSEGD